MTREIDQVLDILDRWSALTPTLLTPNKEVQDFGGDDEGFQGSGKGSGEGWLGYEDRNFYWTPEDRPDCIGTGRGSGESFAEGGPGIGYGAGHWTGRGFAGPNGLSGLWQDPGFQNPLPAPFRVRPVTLCPIWVADPRQIAHRSRYASES